jgi:hypothetical protein
MGASSVLACPSHGDNLDKGDKPIGAEINKRYAKIARRRIAEALNGSLRFRPEYLPVRLPRVSEAVSKRPAHFKIHN